MVFLDLIVHFESENIEELYIQEPEGFQWTFTIECGHCHTEHSNAIYFSMLDEASRSHANFFMKCPNCKRDLSVDIYSKSANRVACPSDGKHKGVLATFECRNVNLKKWVFENGIAARGAGTGTVFEDIDLQDVWCDFDEKNSSSVQIENFGFSIERNNQLK